MGQGVQSNVSRRTDRLTDRQKDRVIPIYPQTLFARGGGGIKAILKGSHHRDGADNMSFDKNKKKLLYRSELCIY